MSDRPDDMSPSDNTTMTRVLRELGEAGWEGQLMAVAGGSVRCTNCDAVTPAAGLHIGAERRLEGASDPDDMSLVIAAECPACQTKSTLVLGYGPAASDEDGDIVVALERGGGSSTSDEDPAVREAHAEARGDDSASPGATLDDDTPAEPNEPG